MTRPLTARQLNRALLARQLLLNRHDLDLVGATEHLGGLQAQIPNPPYLGLWARLTNFNRADLTAALLRGDIVRAPWLRATLHLVTAADLRRFRTTLQPAQEKAFAAFNRKAARAAVDIDAISAAARDFLRAAPRSTGDLRAHLAPLATDVPVETLANVVRCFLPVMQTGPSAVWGSGTRAEYVLADERLGPLDPPDLRALLHRYLAAFGPASMADFQFWLGMTRLKEAVAALAGELVTYHDEGGQTLYDLPGLPLPDPDTPAPIRFVPEYDNLVIAHKDRSRILPARHYKQVFLSAARVRATILVDGFVAGVWRISGKGPSTDIEIEVFEGVDPVTEAAIAAERERLLAWLGPAGAGDPDPPLTPAG